VNYLPLLKLAAAPVHSAITLCATSQRKPWTVSGFRASWRPIKIKLEEEGSVQPGLTLKGLRHTVATILREMNMDYGTIANVLGQRTEAVVKHYSRRADMTKNTATAIKSFAEEVNRRKTKNVKPTSKQSGRKLRKRNDLSELEWCPEADLNHRHADFQSAALPTELSGHKRLLKNLRFFEAPGNVPPRK